MSADQMSADAAVPSPDGFRATRQRLAGAQKSSKGAPAYSRYVNRPAGRSFAALAFLWNRTPNQVTTLSAVFSFGAIAVLATQRPSWGLGVLVTVLLVVGYALDAADGQLARLRGGGSPSGEWLDHVIDCAKVSALHLTVLVSMFRFDRPSRDALLLVPLGFAVVAAVLFFAMILTDQLRRQHRLATGAAAPDSSASALRSLLVIPTDYGFLCLVFLLLGAPDVFRGVYAAFFAANVAFLVLALVKWFREMDSLGRPAATRPTGGTTP